MNQIDTTCRVIVATVQTIAKIEFRFRGSNGRPPGQATATRAARKMRWTDMMA